MESRLQLTIVLEYGSTITTVIKASALNDTLVGYTNAGLNIKQYRYERI